MLCGPGTAAFMNPACTIDVDAGVGSMVGSRVLNMENALTGGECNCGAGVCIHSIFPWKTSPVEAEKTMPGTEASGEIHPGVLSHVLEDAGCQSTKAADIIWLAKLCMPDEDADSWESIFAS